MTDTPWTKEQIDKLNDYQRNGYFHPFTCGGDRSNEAHKAYATANGDRDWGLLQATEQGWICPVCDYKQDWAHWAHPFMFEGAAKPPL